MFRSDIFPFRVLRRHAVWLVAVGATATLVGAVTVPSGSGLAAGDCTVSASEQALDSEEQALLTLISNYRAQNGLVALAA